MAIRKATVDDIEGIMRVQRASYTPDLVEPASIFEAIVACGMSYVATNEENATVVGFLVCHPTIRDTVYALHEPPEHPPASPWAFIHDLSIDPEHRGKGIARKLLAALIDDARARSFIGIQLIAVHGAEAFWRHMGFREAPHVRLD